MPRIGILGGTFDPIHLGHLIPAQYAFNYLRLDRLLLVPSAAPVHRPRHVPAAPEHRLRMCRLAAVSLPGFSASDAEVARAAPSYTVLTLRYLAATLGPQASLVLLVGEDNLPLLHTWRDIHEVLAKAELAVLPRPREAPADLSGLEASLGPSVMREILSRRVPAPLIPISATEIRARLARGQSITGLVPSSVERYIAAAGLYGCASPEAGRNSL